MKRKAPLFLFLIGALLASPPAIAQFGSDDPDVPSFQPDGAVRDKNVVARLVADQSTVVPGETFTLGLELAIDPTWHTYWINPGETGKPTRLDLTLPEGFESGPLQFPVPKRFVTDFGFDILEAGFGYEDFVIHPVTVTVPESAEPGGSFTIQGQADWLMCDPSTCVPGKANLSLTLEVGESAVASPEAAAIEKYRKKVPESVDWPFETGIEDGEVALEITLPEEVSTEGVTWKFHPYQSRVFDQLAEPEVELRGQTLHIDTKKHEDLESVPDGFAGVLIAETEDGKTGYRLGERATAGAPSTGGEPGATDSTDTGADTPPEQTASGEDSDLPFGGGFLGILFAAFLGGMILNIMPCVFPVISLKVMSFVGQAGEDRKKVLAHSIVFALGILIFFWLLAVMMLILRSASGGDVGWGAQLQQPAFILGLIFVMVAVALSLFGVVEIGASMTAVGGELTNKSGYAGSFWSGALAVLLATPCTAPLMAPAIGFALAQSAPVMLAVFTALGLGLAAPYFLFAAFPKLLDVIPAPGPWMETFKQFMGFPMLAVAVWLTGVLSKQLDIGGLQWALAGVLFLALAAWILGRFGSYERKPATRTRAKVAAGLVFLLALGTAYWASGQRASASGIDLRAVIAEHREEGRHVFVDFTADWCVTCKVNERTTIKTDAVKELFAQNNIELVIADWTLEDPNITEVLRDFGRAGVPFYVLYPADSSRDPIPLGDGLITVGDVREAVEQL